MRYEPLRTGARVTANGVEYRVWAPDIKQATVDIHCLSGGQRFLALARDGQGFYFGLDKAGKPGDAYFYVLDDRGAFPDPASRAQEQPASGRSLVIDPGGFHWSDQDWKRPLFRDLVIYELHVGAFTSAGTFLAAAEKLPFLRDLGVTAIQLMPIADWPGGRNWGYDGVFLYAPAAAYGTPDSLRALVDRAHTLGMAVILDVVYNHFGPSGNVLAQFAKGYFHPERHTPWGNAFNLDGPDCEPVRAFFRSNPGYWMAEFHIDGFRMDATHEIADSSTPHLLAEMTEAIHAAGGYAIAEDSRNDVGMLASTKEGGMGFDAVWADDFHHAACVSQTDERVAWFSDFEGSTDEMLSILNEGWLYSGQWSEFAKANRGTPAGSFPPECFVHCISNHDQVGNRALGERLNHRISPEAYRALSMLLLLSPFTPLLFMGQEWAASTPFLFFTDHEPDLGTKITEGRRREFSHFAEFAEASAQKRIPDPQACETFDQSKLRWEERSEAPHAGVLSLYKECLFLRRTHAAFRPPTRSTWKTHALDGGAGALCLEGTDGRWLLVFDLKGRHPGKLPGGNWKQVLSSNERRFGGDGRSSIQQGEFLPEGPVSVLLWDTVQFPL